MSEFKPGMNHPELPQVIEQIAAHLHISPDQIKCAPIRHGTHERNNVWRLTAMGRSFLLKQHLITHPVGESAFAPFQVESAVLSTLHRAGCRVPEIHWGSESAECLLMEWCGDTTLDDLAQGRPTEGLKPIVQNTVRSFCQLETGFAKSAHALTPYIYPLDYSEFLRDTMQALLDRGRKTMDYLAWLAGQPMPPNQEAEIDKIWARLANRLHGAKHTLGTLDYNARNVVIDGQLPTFIDFGSIGWDWGERRLVQSFNSLGANRKGGNFVSVLDRETVEAYASQVVKHREGESETELATQVDYHHLLFYLSVVHRLLQSTAQPEAEESKSLLRAWCDPKARFQRAVGLLVGSRLSEDSDAAQIREFIAAFRDASKQSR